MMTFVNSTSSYKVVFESQILNDLQTVLFLEAVSLNRIILSTLPQCSVRKLHRHADFLWSWHASYVPPQSSSDICKRGSSGQRVREWGIHSSVVFYLAGNRGYLPAVEGQWRLEELATDQEFISLNPGLAPKVCERQKVLLFLGRHH